jgi:hypothetical protein
VGKGEMNQGETVEKEKVVSDMKKYGRNTLLLRREKRMVETIEGMSQISRRGGSRSYIPKGSFDPAVLLVGIYCGHRA